MILTYHFIARFTTLNVLAMTGMPAAFWDVALGGVTVDGRIVPM